MKIRPSASISKLTFSGDQEFYFKPKEKVILVGPNNSGKSQTLREIIAVCQNGDQARPFVLKKVEILKLGTSDDLRNFLEENASYRDSYYSYKSWRIHYSAIKGWNVQSYLQNGLSGGYIKNIDANERLQICTQQKSIGPDDQQSKPQHILYDNSALMGKVSCLFRQAFGQDIMFDYRGGSVIPIHVGKLPHSSLVDRVGDAYVAAVRANPLLDRQGDGMKSYAGILFETIVADLDINLLDEPEAFLHPPQMRRLGETLASEVRGQLIVATHSSDIMRGFLEGTKGNVRVLRIRREGLQNFVSEAEPAVIQELWARPELRYSNALEGVFHEETIICEDDSDCRVFNAVADYLAAKDDKSWKDTAYVPTGGKHGVRKVAEVLRNIGVPIKVVFDIDFLSEKNVVRDTVQAFGGNWEEIEPLWTRVDAAVRNGVKPKSFEEIKSELILLIENCNGEKLPRGEITEVMKQTSSWNLLKKFGKDAIPNGEAQSQYEDLKCRLEDIGIYLVPVGEIENFCRDLGSHGPKFVNKLLTEVSFDDVRLDSLRQFVSLVHKGKHAPLSDGVTKSVDNEENT
ncbi:ATP-binding protein [Acetobacter sicerae]|uniref:ATP-binding protein n=1 Tax=Acetobacter sicerae TaxID=85325 RepID=A0ABS8W2D9_9PROT|nr:AAA family ATPase [Acetobacter sicerae]MCE0745326.1 ATP-binding protein [Acetobacter sicerae]